MCVLKNVFISKFKKKTRKFCSPFLYAVLCIHNICFNGQNTHPNYCRFHEIQKFNDSSCFRLSHVDDTTSPEQNDRRHGVRVHLVQFYTEREQAHPVYNIEITKAAYYHSWKNHGSVARKIYERKIQLLRVFCY